MSGFFTAPHIAWGQGAIEQLSSLGAHRAFLLVDPAVAAHDGHRRIVEELTKSETTIETVSDLPAPDRFEAVNGLAERLAAFAPDWVVAVGGGRTIDAAKAARLRFEQPNVALASITPVVELPDPPRSRLVALPTTSGSGAEASWACDLWDPEGGPMEVAHRGATPEWALTDPGLAASLSPELVLDGALEGAAQAVEAYLSAWANPFSDALALDAVTTIVTRLPHALRWSDDPEARTALHYAATAAGLASSNAHRGVAHALARALIAPTGLSYGRLVGIALPHVLEFDYPSARERIETLAFAVARPDESGRVPLVARLRRLYESFRFPSDLAAAGVPRESLDAARASIVASTLRSPATLANPRVPSPREVEELLDAVSGGSAGRRVPP